MLKSLEEEHPGKRVWSMASKAAEGQWGQRHTERERLGLVWAPAASLKAGKGWQLDWRKSKSESEEKVLF